MAQSPSAASPSFMKWRGKEGCPVGDGADLYCVPGILSDNEEEKGDMGKRERASEMLMTSYCALCRMDSIALDILILKRVRIQCI